MLAFVNSLLPPIGKQQRQECFFFYLYVRFTGLTHTDTDNTQWRSMHNVCVKGVRGIVLNRYVEKSSSIIMAINQFISM